MENQLSKNLKWLNHERQCRQHKWTKITAALQMCLTNQQNNDQNEENKNIKKDFYKWAEHELNLNWIHFWISSSNQIIFFSCSFF